MPPPGTRPAPRSTTATSGPAPRRRTGLVAAAVLVVVLLAAAIAFVLLRGGDEEQDAGGSGDAGGAGQQETTAAPDPTLLREPDAVGAPPAPDGLTIAAVGSDGDSLVVDWDDDDPAEGTTYQVVVYTAEATELWPTADGPTTVELTDGTPVCVEVVALDARWRRSDPVCANDGDATDLVVHDEL